MRNIVIYIYLFASLYSCKEGTQDTQMLQKTISSDLKDQLQLLSHSTEIMDTATINRQIAFADSIYAYDPEVAKNILSGAARYSYQIAYHEGLALSIKGIGINYLEMGKPDTALFYLNQALVISKHVDPALGIAADIYNSIASLYFELSYSDSATTYLYKTMEELNKHAARNDSMAARAYRNIGILWISQQDNEQALFYLNKAEKFAGLANDSMGVLQIAIDKVGIHFNNRQWDSVVMKYQSLLNNHLINDRMRIGLSLNLGTALRRQGRPQEAVKHYKEGYRLAKAANDQFTTLNSSVLLGVGYLISEDYKKAVQVLKETLNAFEKLGVEEEGKIEYIHLNLADAYKKTNQYKKANQELVKVMDIRGKRNQREKIELRNKLDIQYRVAEKDKLLLQQENKLKNKNILIGGLSLSALLLCAFLLSAYRSHQHKKQVHAKEMLLLQQQQEIKQLQSMMKGEEKERARLARELHDGVGGMLASIKMNVSVAKSRDNPFAKATDLDEVLLLVEQTAEEVRRTSHNLMPEVLRKYNLPQALRMYCEGLNNGKALQIDLQFHSEWPEEKLELELPLYRILQELIQNVIKHAHASYMIIQFRFQDDKLHVTTEDDGIGFETDKKGSGLGLSNIRSRVTALRGNLFMESYPGKGTTCYIELPVWPQKNTSHE